jgi:hypothetical protein
VEKCSTKEGLTIILANIKKNSNHRFDDVPQDETE